MTQNVISRSFIKKTLVKYLKFIPVLRGRREFLSKKERTKAAYDSLCKIADRQQCDWSVDEIKLIMGKWCRLSFENAPCGFIREYFNSFFLGGGRADSCDLVGEIVKIDPLLLDYNQWLFLYEIAGFRGFFYSADVIREKAKESLLKGGETGLREGSRVFLAKLWVAHESCSLYNNVVLPDAFDSSEREITEQFALAQAIDLQIDFETVLGENCDDRFRDFVLGKNIAVVGPSNSEEACGEEIDSFDIVVRTNYSYSGKGLDPLTRGTRCDVSYFNGSAGTRFFEEQRGCLPDDIEWACFKDEKHIFSSSLKSDEKKIRYTSSPRPRSFHGDAMALLVVLIDLLCHGCGMVKVFHANFMLDFERYAGYSPHFDVTDMVYKKNLQSMSLALHDPVLQYYLVRRMWENKLVVGDMRFEEVMGMGIVDYLVELEKVFGSF